MNNRPYQDPSLPVDQRVEDLLSHLPLTEKVGLMFHTMAIVGDPEQPLPLFDGPSLQSLLDKGLTHFNLIGSTKDGHEFAQWHNKIQRIAAQRPHAVPVSFSTDPRHHFGDNPLTQIMAGPFSQWPEPLGLAAIGSAERMEEFADIVRQEYVAVGIRMALHPQIDLATEPRWSRINATFGEDADLTSTMGVAYVQGLQGTGLQPGSVAAMVKHFPGGGPQKDGDDPHFSWGREQVYPGANADYHLRPFRAALDAGAAAVMPYYGMPVGTDWEEVGFGFNKSVITALLREQLGFDGVVCTDWGLITNRPDLGEFGAARAWGVEQLSREDRMLAVIEAGCDQFGGEDCTEELLELVHAGRVTEARIDESARRLLRVKFELGLFDNPYVDEDKAVTTVGRDDFRAAGLAAQQDSLTLLTNEDRAGAALLPLPRGIKLYAPELTADAAAGYAELVDNPADADVALLRLKAPFDKGGDGLAQLFHHGSLEFAPDDVQQILDVCNTVPTVVDLYLDRPAVVTPFTDAAAAIMVNYGIGESALLDVLFGESGPQGALPFDLPRSDAAVAASRTDVAFDTADPVFRFGHGLRYS